MGGRAGAWGADHTSVVHQLSVAFLHFQEPLKPPGVATHILLSFSSSAAFLQLTPPNPSPSTLTPTQTPRSLFEICRSHFPSTLTVSLHLSRFSTAPRRHSLRLDRAPFLRTAKKTEESLRNTSRAKRNPEKWRAALAGAEPPTPTGPHGPHYCDVTPSMSRVCSCVLSFFSV